MLGRNRDRPGPDAWVLGVTPDRLEAGGRSGDGRQRRGREQEKMAAQGRSE
jgi:hypothetical protein